MRDTSRFSVRNSKVFYRTQDATLLSCTLFHAHDLRRGKCFTLNDVDPDFRLGKILVAIDGSAIADYALNLAIHIGEKYNSKIDLLYVIPAAAPPSGAPLFDPMFGPSVLTPRAPEISAQGSSQRSSANEKRISLLNERKQLVESQNLACEAISISSDDVSGEIIRQGESHDLISVGSRGLSGLKSLILGSVSKKVAKESKTTVLIVKSRIDTIPKILLAYDGSEPAKKALKFASELGLRFNATVNVLCVAGIPISPEGYISTDIDRWENEMKSYVEYAVSFLKKQGVNSSGRTADSRDVSRAISDEAVKGGYDLIILGSRGYGRLKSLFLGSVASGVADSSKTNVLIVR